MKEEKKELKNAKREPKNERLNGVKTVIFDLDGTLYDKRGLAHRMVRRLWWCLPLLMSERLARRQAHEVQYPSGEAFFDAFFATMARGHWWSAKMAEKWYNHVYLPAMVRLIAKHHPAREEALELLDECKAHGLKTAIYSDYGCVTDKLEALEIDPSQFALIISAPELGALKPSQPCAQRVLELLDAKPETTLFVGDRDEKDGESARSVGAKFLLIS
jgi:HAD superfamily hydrolase (TIGR01549 family)